MEQNNLIVHVKEIKNSVLIRAVMNPQLSDFPSNDIRIGPLKIRPFFLQERQICSYLSTRLLVQFIKEFIDGRIASLCCIQNKTIQVCPRISLLYTSYLMYCQTALFSIDSRYLSMSAAPDKRNWKKLTFFSRKVSQILNRTRYSWIPFTIA